MNDTRIDAWVILFVTFFIFLMITMSGCSHQPYPSGVYLGEYIVNQMDYNANNNKESLIEANKNWNMYLKTRIND